MSGPLTDRDLALGDYIVDQLIARLDAREDPTVSGEEAAKLLGVSYKTFKCQHLDNGDIFPARGTKKKYERADVLSLKRKRAQVAHPPRLKKVS